MKALKVVLAAVAFIGLLTVLAGVNKVTCVPAAPEEPVCAAAKDCEGLPHEPCDGQWSCVTGLCSYECKEPEPAACYVDTDCGEGFYCEFTNECCPPQGCMPGMPCPAVCVACGVCKALDEPSCYSDKDCAAGQICQITDGCCPDPNCPMCAVCAECGVCVDIEPGCCGADKACAMGLVCVAGVCEKVPPAGMCWADADCGEGGKCVGAITCPCGAMCFAASQPGKCDYGQPSACYANDDCAAGETCEITNDCCAPEGCLPGMICPAVCVPCGQCVQSLPTQCFADSECPAGFICEVTAECPPCTYMDPPCMMPCKAVGKCVPSGGCLSDADCDDGDPCTGDYCHNGACENVAKSSCCQKIDPFAYGMCEMFMGFGFDGTKCVGVSGCGCGADCGKIYKTLDECKKACAA